MASRGLSVGQVSGDFTKEAGLPDAAQLKVQSRARQGGDPAVFSLPSLLCF